MAAENYSHCKHSKRIAGFCLIPQFPPCFYTRGRAWCFAGFAYKFLGFASITVILPAFRCTEFLGFWVTVNRGQPFSSMAELPAPPAPVGPVEIAEEPAAGAVPVGAETEAPAVVENEVFFSPIVFGVVFFLFSCFTCLEFFVVILRLASSVAWFSFLCPLFFTASLKVLANGFNICFNILSILLNGNVESVCQPLSTLL